MKNEKPIRTSFTQGQFIIEVRHNIDTNVPNISGGEIIMLKPKENEPNMKSLITVYGENLYKNLFVNWRYIEFGAENFGILLIEDTRTLFVAAGYLVCNLDLNTHEIISYHEYSTNFFWEFKRIGQFIVEFGELDCYLYDTSGYQIDHAQVDPPYEYQSEKDGIRLMSPVYGEQWLKYPTK